MPTESETAALAKHIEGRERGLDRDLLPYGNPAGKDVLVFGCSLGSEIVWAARHGAKSVIGVDLVPIPPEPLARVMEGRGLGDFRNYKILNQNVHDLALAGGGGST